jgi:hypothetical protein
MPHILILLADPHHHKPSGRPDGVGSRCVLISRKVRWMFIYIICCMFRGSLHTWGKSRDHEIVRAQKKVSKSRPNTPAKTHVVWSQILKSSVKSYVTGFSTKCHFHEFLFMRGPRTRWKWNKPTVVNVRSAMVSRLCVRPTSKRWFLKIIKVTMKHDTFDAMQESM